jgi:hypothetical protein
MRTVPASEAFHSMPKSDENHIRCFAFANKADRYIKSRPEKRQLISAYYYAAVFLHPYPQHPNETWRYYLNIQKRKLD